ncbi:MAG: carbon monoxide dehydrogenase [Bdellovibrionales bacterium RIFOXYD12_FULL_39_22]|nr:MAG: carbon monoxide dehydrogenase [Bdellovibrionales bacterium RIFOXYB1_FULL_39_21]OFZ45232.1 MAG: carbon monoxide dehydrogenase [Bdellovibrionales bacterium RIFOXYC12_FULL_39_17]OFZ45693.1 MAG: carbon monoxide dehydrogenase [Bdellovibrionales bacterium RIFOXYC1_FULL_39_130]OFZ73113.1 MAG: carbon monoxide dehydrogenase [Bdellovibrionales bacterium RIFOXYC2_FULL_39_8]OFZ77438.1 MAG: carbon monoxide dehydrogenase [Bdellovibrionales bacterium RIFOXYD1_FULL_39_84]OFZ91567.1 MAG: carbon monoxid
MAKKLSSQNRNSVRIKINGNWREFSLGTDSSCEINPTMTLSYFLREKLGFTGLKVACNEGACGACTILMDGKTVLSCMMLAVQAEGHEVVTIEGLEKNDPVVEAFAQQCAPGYGTALQCGLCTPGFVMSAKALLKENPRPNIGEVKEALSGHICRCGCYSGVAQAVMHAGEKIANKGECHE